MGVSDPHLLSVEHPAVTVPGPHGTPSAKASDPLPASDSAYAPTVSAASLGKYLALSSAEAQRKSALITSVFCTSTNDTNRRIDARQLLDR